MSKLKELVDARTDKFAEASNLADLAEERAHTPEERAQFNQLSKEINDLDSEIAHERSVMAFRAARTQGYPGGGEDGNRDISKKDQRDLATFNLGAAILAKADGRSLSGIESEVQQIGEKRAAEDGIELDGGIVVLDSLYSKRGQTVTGQTTNPGDQGGLLVEKELQGVLELIRSATFLDKVGATFLTGLTGDLSFPVQLTQPTIQELTEIEQMNDSEVLFGNFEMKPTRRGTNVPFSRQLLRQSATDIQQLVLLTISNALADKMNTEAITTLLSIITSGNNNLLALGTNGATPTYANIVGLEKLVDGVDHNRGLPKYLTNTAVKSILKLTQKFSGTNGAPVWDDANEMNGYPAVVSNIVPSNLTKGTAANICSAIIYGNFKDFYVGQWGGTEYIVDPYSQKKKSQIEVTANAFWSMKAARVKSFSGIKDALTA